MMIRYRRYCQALEVCVDHKGVPADQWVAAEFSQLTQWFLNQLGVKYGYGVASYLGYSTAIDNHRVIGLWFQEKMKCTRWPIFSVEELKQQIKMRVPREYFN